MGLVSSLARAGARRWISDCPLRERAKDLEVVVRKASGLVLIAAGAGLLDIGYSMPPSNNAVEPERQSEIAMSQPVSPGPGSTVAPDGWQTRWRADVVPATEPRPTPVVVRLPAKTALPPPSKVAAMPSDRAALARALQRDLKRVGCYEGQLDTGWTPQTRKAMQAFNDRVNAKLPIGEPNEILLLLVQSQEDRVCGAPCPPGQSLADEGRCLPNAILAQAHMKALQRTAVTRLNDPTAAAESTSSTISSWSITATTMTPAFPLPDNQERMALAGPTNANAPGLPLHAASSKPPRSTTPHRSNFGQGFFKRFDRMGIN
jgi:hypothetical protein